MRRALASQTVSHCAQAARLQLSMTTANRPFVPPGRNAFARRVQGHHPVLARDTTAYGKRGLAALQELQTDRDEETKLIGTCT